MPTSINALVDIPEWQALNAVDKLDFLTEYEGNLQRIADEQYSGGYQRYQKDNPSILTDLEDLQRNVYAEESGKIEATRSQTLKNWYQETIGGESRGLLQDFMVTLGRGWYQSGAMAARFLGYDKAADRWEKNRDKIRAGYDVISNNIAEFALKAEDKTRIGLEAYEFLKNFFPAIQPQDRNILNAIAKEEGWTENVAGMLGHFARIKTIMAALPRGKFIGPVSDLVKNAEYSLRYGIAAGISRGLELPVHQNSLTGTFGTGAWTFLAMLTGTSFASFVAKSPVMAGLFKHMPAAVAEFTRGRVADIGESIVNSAEYAVSTGDPWGAIKAFPAALIANMIEEMIIDLPGMGGGFTRKGRLGLKQAALGDLENIRLGLQEKLTFASEKDKPKLRKALSRIVQARDKRKSEFQDALKKEIGRPNSLINTERADITARMNGYIDAGMDRDAALEKAVVDIYVEDVEDLEAYRSIKEPVEEATKNVLDTVESLGETAIEEREEIEEVSREEAEEIVEEEEAELARQTEEAIVEAQEPEVEKVVRKRVEKELKAEERADIRAERARVKREEKKIRAAARKEKYDAGTIKRETRESPISLASAEAMGWDMQLIRQTPRIRRLFKAKGGAIIDTELIPDYQARGLIPAHLDFQEASEWLESVIVKEEIKAVPIEYSSDVADAISEMDQIERAYQQGIISEEERDKELEKFGKAKALFSIAKKSNMKVGGLESIIRWLATHPDERIRKTVIINKNGQIEINVKAFRREYGRDPFPHEYAVAKTTIFADGKAVIEIADENISISKAHHDAYHIARELALKDNKRDIGILEDRYDTLAEEADEYGRWVEHQETDTVIGKIFQKIKEFLDRLLKALKGQGFRTSTDVFSDIYNKRISVTPQPESLKKYKEDYINPGFINDEGYLPVLQHRDYPDAYKKNWVRKEASVNGVEYAARKLDSKTLNRIQEDLKKYDPMIYEDAPVTLESADKYFFFSTADFFAKGQKLSAVLDAADSKSKVEGEWYAAETDPNMIKEAEDNSVFTRFFQQPKEIISNIKEKMLWISESKSEEDINFVERWFSLFEKLAMKNPHLRKLAQAQDRRDILPKHMRKRFFEIIDPLMKSSIPVYRESREAILKADELGRKLKKAELAKYSDEAILGYEASLATGDEELNTEKRHWMEIIADLEEIMATNISEETRADIQGRIDKCNEEIDKIEELRDKGYFPHDFDEKALYHITVNADINQLTKKQVDNYIKALRTMKGDLPYWAERTVRDMQRGVGVIRHNFNYRRRADFREEYDAIRKLIPEAHISAGPIKRDRNPFDLGATRLKIREIVQKITNRAKSRAKGETTAEQMATLEAIDLMIKELDAIEKATGHNRHRLHREGYLGYEIKDIRGVWTGRINGYTGFYAKRKAAQEFMEIYSNIPLEQKNTRARAEDFIELMLKNRDMWDEMQGKFISTLSMKYLAFNPAYHIRNRWQNWYFGMPVLQKHLGWKGVPGAAKQMYRAQVDIRFLELWLMRNQVTYNNYDKLVEEIKGLNKKDVENILYALNNGLLDAQLPDEWREGYEGTINKTPPSKMMGGLLKLAKNSIVASDTKNRLQFFLATTRLGIDNDTAMDWTREANVAYKKWNVPGFLSTKTGSRFRFLFPFQKFTWHVTEWQIRNMVNGHFGSVLAFWIISALLGGKEAIPFFKELKKLFGPVATTKMRNRLIKACGGRKKLIELLDYGAFGLIGVDFSQKFQVNPFKITDPLFGNTILSEWQKMKRLPDSVARGRWQKAIFEDFILTPSFMTKLSRAVRQYSEGLTTYTGTHVLDLDDKPVKLTNKDLFMVAFGLMPTRLADHYKARKGARDLINYYSLEKSRIGTRYKVALHENDKEDLNYIKDLIREYNSELEKNAIDGVTVVPAINKRTLSAWRRGSDTKRVRAIAKTLNP